MKRVAFCTVPHIGGIYSVYQKLRASLADKGFDVLGVQVGDELDRWEYRPELRDDGIHRVAANETDLKKSSQAFCQWVTEHDIKIVMPMSSPAALAAVPHLPNDVRVVTRCISIGTQSCRLVASNLDRVSRIVYTSPAQKDELIRRYRVMESKFCHIPNCVDVTKFAPDAGRVRDTKQLRIVYLGRLIQRQKNVFAIPDICHELRLAKIPFHMSIIGCGGDEEALRQRMNSPIENGEVRFLGSLPHSEIVPLLQKSDCLLLTSSEEGFPNTMIEAMACGVVPVVSHLPGITDWVINCGQNGFLCDYREPRSFMDAFQQIHRQREFLNTASQRARATVVQRFSLEHFADSWSSLFTDVLDEPVSWQSPKNWDQFQPSNAFGKPKFGWLPSHWRTRLRRLLSATGIEPH